MKIRFSVFGKPMGKARPRFTLSGHAYTPETTREYEQRVRAAYLEHARSDHFADRPVAVEIMAFFPIPKRATKAQRAATERREEFPTCKPDCDNICKIVCDALNGVAYRDDAQVVAVICQKCYGANPSVHVVITDWSEYSADKIRGDTSG